MEMVLTVFGFLAGAILGSLALSLAERSLQEKSSFWGRSYCPKCKHKLHWYDLIPIFSYLILRGQCRYCRSAIGIEYLLVEMIMGILIAFLFSQTALFDLPFKIFFITVLAVLFLTDLKEMLIPDRIILPAIIISLIYLVIFTLFKIGYLYYYLSQSEIGKLLLPPKSDYFERHAIITAEPLIWGILLGLLIAGFFYALILITKGKGMGGGDVKLGAFIGIVLGFPQGLLAIVLSFLLGAVFSVVLLLTGKKHFGQVIPFGPFLVTGSLVTLFWGKEILDWYINLGT